VAEQHTEGDEGDAPAPHEVAEWQRQHGDENDHELSPVLVGEDCAWSAPGAGARSVSMAASTCCLRPAESGSSMRCKGAVMVLLQLS
jgi:hypothetical protein